MFYLNEVGLYCTCMYTVKARGWQSWIFICFVFVHKIITCIIPLTNAACIKKDSKPIADLICIKRTKFDE